MLSASTATNVVAVHVSGNSIRLDDVSKAKASTGDQFNIGYTATQVILTGRNGTEFRVGNQTLETYTITISQPVNLSLNLNRRANTVSIEGDGTTALGNVDVRLGSGKENNSLSLRNAITNNLTVFGGRHDDTLKLTNSTVNGALYANLGWNQSDTLDFETSTVKGNILDYAGTVIANHGTFNGRFDDIQLGKNSRFYSTASTYNGAVAMRMGKAAIINYYGSTEGANKYHSSLRIIGSRGHTSINEGTNTVTHDIAPVMKRVNPNIVSSVGTPTVDALTATTSTPTITGAWDSVKASTLKVTVNSVTYTLGTDAKLTTPTAGKWSLDLTGAPLPGGANTVAVVNSDVFGNTATGTGTVTAPGADPAQLTSIHTFLTNNSLTGTQTASGLNYVVTTAGTGATPTNGQKVTVNYTGHILNANGTLGTEFDSNTDAAFGHVSPFQFTLGQGAVIKGWDEAFLLFKVGTVGKLLIPSSIGYGTTGSGSKIPPNSILVFDFTLVSSP